MLEVKLVDCNDMWVGTAVNGVGLCRNANSSILTLEKCVDAEHYSTLENMWFAFEVSGLSVKARIQLLRHRMFSTIERSTRSIYMGEAECIVPATAENPDLFKISYKRALSDYRELVARGESLEDASYVLPVAVETKFMMSGNGRMFFEYLQKRLCKKHVQAEHFTFARDIYYELCGVHDGVFGDIFCKADPCRKCEGCDLTV